MLSIRSGSAAAGKERLLAICREYGKVLVIVPEQYTLQTERDLIHGLHAPGFFDIEVLSPSRLTERVFAAAGQDALIRIDDRGKQMALARVLTEEKKNLKYFESAAAKQGFIARMGTLIASFKQSGLTAAAAVPKAVLELHKGDMIQHKAFGKGMVLTATKIGNDTLLEIAFDGVGTKKMFANTASVHMKKL